MVTTLIIIIIITSTKILKCVHEIFETIYTHVIAIGPTSTSSNTCPIAIALTHLRKCVEPGKDRHLLFFLHGHHPVDHPGGGNWALAITLGTIMTMTTISISIGGMWMW